MLKISHLCLAMKKFLILLTAFFYLSVASGLGMNFHYCMDKLVDWSLMPYKTEKCQFCGMKKANSTKENCCKDVSHQSEIDGVQQVATTIFSFQTLSFALVQTIIPGFGVDLFRGRKQLTIYGEHSPLGLSCPLFIKNCTYRI